MPIIPHANGETLLKRSSSPVCNDSASCLVCKQRCDGNALTSKASSNILNDDTYQCVCAGKLPTCTSQQGNVIRLVSVMYVCVYKKIVI